MRLNGFNSTSTLSSNSIRLRCHMITAQLNWDTPLPAASLLPRYACCAQGQSQIHQHLWFQYAWYVWHGYITISLIKISNRSKRCKTQAKLSNFQTSLEVNSMTTDYRHFNSPDMTQLYKSLHHSLRAPLVPRTTWPPSGLGALGSVLKESRAARRS